MVLLGIKSNTHETGCLGHRNSKAWLLLPACWSANPLTIPDIWQAVDLQDFCSDTAEQTLTVCFFFLPRTQKRIRGSAQMAGPDGRSEDCVGHRDVDVGGRGAAGSCERKQSPMSPVVSLPSISCSAQCEWGSSGGLPPAGVQSHAALLNCHPCWGLSMTQLPLSHPQTYKSLFTSRPVSDIMFSFLSVTIIKHLD